MTGLSIDKVSDFFKYTFGIVPHVPHNVQSNENGTVTVTLASQNDLETVLKLSTQLPQVRWCYLFELINCNWNLMKLEQF